MLRSKRTKAADIVEREPNLVEEPTSSYFSTETSSLPVSKTIFNDDDKDLESRVLGGAESFLQKLKPVKDQTASDSSDGEGPEEVSSRKPPQPEERKPAWIDEDDEKTVKLPNKRNLDHLKLSTDSKRKIAGSEYGKRLKKEFNKTIGYTETPSWANRQPPNSKKTFKDSDSEADEAEEALVQTTGKFVTSSKFLPRQTLHFKRLQDPTFGHRTRKPLQSVEFHKQSRVLLTAGQAQQVALFEIDGKKNPLLTSVRFDDFPLEMARFSSEGNRVIASSSRRPYLHYFDLLTEKVVRVNQCKGMQEPKLGKFVISPGGNLIAVHGRYGQFHLLSGKSFEWIRTLKMNADLSCMTFSKNNPDILYTHGDSGRVYVWDVRRFECINQFVDEGCIHGTSLDITEDGTLLAAGSDTGVVNLYESLRLAAESQPKPIKSVQNLTTTADSLRFSPTGEVLAIASSAKDNAVRLLHIGSRTVFDNFPEMRSAFTRVTCMDFSRNSGYFCMGNERGQAMLIRMLHYADY